MKFNSIRIYIIRPFLTLVSILAFLYNGKAQVVSFSYAGSGLSTNGCNVFYPATAVTASNSSSYTHTSMSSEQTFNGTALGMISFKNGSSIGTNSFAISYPLTAGYTYSVTTNLKNTVYSLSHPFGPSNPPVQTFGNTTKVLFGVANSLPYTSTESCATYTTPQSPFTSVYSTTVVDDPNTNMNVVSTGGFLVNSNNSYLLIGTVPGPITDGLTDYVLSTTYINNVAITGVPPISPDVSSFCTSQTYSINTSQPVSWSASPSGIVSLSVSGTSVTVIKVSDGVVTLTATVSDPNGNPIVINKTIGVGGPAVSFYIQPFWYTENHSFCTNSFSNNFEVISSDLPNVTAFEWGISPSTVIDANGWLQEQGVVFSTAGFYQIYCRAKNACGYGNSNTATYNLEAIDCVGGLASKPKTLSVTNERNGASSLAIYPNPVTSKVTVILPADLNLQHTSIKFLDVSGRKVKFVTGISNSKTEINVSDLPAGYFVVEVTDGRKLYTKKILK